MKYRLTDYISIPQAAKLLGFKSASSMHTILDSGEIAFIQPHKHRRVLVKDVLDYRDRVTTPASGAIERLEEVLHQ